ncbi:arsenite methyltransferase-like [Bombina bombina]|uniref:arsenite methyltransferase-like n=1 Tax=Bombina bombina TaxID=8345 RepID=UPI00235A75E6|nr:arsenite methyltransferase-like [Bombina bombina]
MVSFACSDLTTGAHYCWKMSAMSSTTSSCSTQGLQIYQDVKDYYGKHLKSSEDLQTNACVTPAKTLPKYIRDALGEVHEDISSRYYGCGLTVPECLENCRILDLGSGSGRDCYMLSKLVGQKGHVTGIDMTDEQVEVSRKYIDFHMQKFGYQQPNVDFVQGYIEDLNAANLKDNSYDLIISNCVINLSPDKRKVLNEAYRVLKDGGEMYFSDMYANQVISEEMKQNKVLWGEGMSGALWWEDLFSIGKEIGFTAPRLVTASYITVNNKELEDAIGNYKFVSATFRLFKLPQGTVKEKCLAIYKGGITGCETELNFDVNFTFKEGTVTEIDEELSAILKKSRFADAFLFQPLESKSILNGCQPKKKEIIRDPFQFAEQTKSLKTPSATSCCESKGCC